MVTSNLLKRYYISLTTWKNFGPEKAKERDSIRSKMFGLTNRVYFY